MPTFFKDIVLPLCTLTLLVLLTTNANAYDEPFVDWREGEKQDLLNMCMAVHAGRHYTDQEPLDNLDVDAQLEIMLDRVAAIGGDTHLPMRGEWIWSNCSVPVRFL